VSIDEQIRAAFDRLMAGHPELSDGRLTVTNICSEAGVSRASFYRSSQATEIRRALSEPDAAPRPQTKELRAQVKALGQAEQASRAQQATQVRELRNTVATYANQIQLLALRVDQLEADNRRLQHRLDQVGDNVTRLPTQH